MLALLRLVHFSLPDLLLVPSWPLTTPPRPALPGRSSVSPVYSTHPATGRSPHHLATVVPPRFFKSLNPSLSAACPNLAASQTAPPRRATRLLYLPALQPHCPNQSPPGRVGRSCLPWRRPFRTVSFLPARLSSSLFISTPPHLPLVYLSCLMTVAVFQQGGGWKEAQRQLQVAQDAVRRPRQPARNQQPKNVTDCVSRWLQDEAQY